MTFILQLVVGIVLSLASTLLQQAFAQKPETRTGTRGTTDLGGKVPQYFLLGTIGDAGKLEYQGTWAHDGGLPNGHLVNVISFGDLPITAMVSAFVNGTRVVLDTDHPGDPYAYQGYPLDEFNDKFRWRFYDGTQTTADAYLVDKFGDAELSWTSSMIGRGVPYVITTAYWDEKTWTRFPEFLGEFQGIPLYDVRKDSTAGGTGTHRWDDHSTWEFSDNNIVMIYNILRGIYYEGSYMWGGSCTAAQLPYASWSAAMDACDEVITLAIGGGSEKRFRAGLRVNLNETPSDIITRILNGCNGRISHCSDGTVYVLVGIPEAADGVFSDEDVLATEPLGSIPFPNLDGIINGGTATFLEPDQAWGDKETAPYYRTDLEAEDDNRQLLEGMDLSTTFSGTQAQRVLKAVIEEGRRFRTHVVALPPEFRQYPPLSVLSWTSSRFGYTNKKFLVTARTKTPWSVVVLALQEVDPSDFSWDPETDEQEVPSAPIVINRPAPQPMTGWVVSPYILFDGAAEGRRPGIEIGYTGGLPDVRAVRVQVRSVGVADPFFDGEFPYDVSIVSPSNYVVTAAILPNEDYEVRGMFLPFSGRETLWSDWLNVTTPDVKLGPLDIEVDLEALADSVGEQLSWVKNGVRTLIDRFREIGSILEEVDRENAYQRGQLSRELRLQIDSLEAGFVEVIEVALGPGGAIATALQSLYAAMGGNTSEVNVRWEAVAAPGGYAARYAIQAAVNDGSFRAATFFMDVPSNPALPTRIVLDADQLLFTDTTGSTPMPAVVIEGGELKFVGARAGRISDVTGVEMIIDFDGKEIYMS